MNTECRVVVTPLDWLTVLRQCDDNTLEQTYRLRVIQQFVARASTAAWCSNPKGCTRVVYWAGPRAQEDVVVTCVCGWRFCWKCSASPHAPARCDQVKQWTLDNNQVGMIFVFYLSLI